MKQIGINHQGHLDPRLALLCDARVKVPVSAWVRRARHAWFRVVYAQRFRPIIIGRVAS